MKKYFITVGAAIIALLFSMVCVVVMQRPNASVDSQTEVNLQTEGEAIELTITPSPSPRSYPLWAKNWVEVKTKEFPWTKPEVICTYNEKDELKCK